MSIRWDSLLTRHLAREFNETLAGSRLRAIRLDGRTRDALLFFRDRTLVWRLHPNRGYPLIREAIEPESTDLRLKTRLRGVRAPIDERMLIFELTSERGSSGPYEFIVELLGTQLNAIVTEGTERTIRHALRTRDGRRRVKIGRPYEPPPPTDRIGGEGPVPPEAWAALLNAVPPLDRAKELTRGVAWVSPINASWLLGDGDAEDGDLGDDEAGAGDAADDRAANGASLGRWASLVDGSRSPAPAILHTDRGLQPYPFALPGVESRTVDSLVQAFEEVVQEDADATDAPAALSVGPGLLARLDEAVVRAKRRVAQLQAQLDGREEPAAMRAFGDLILARYADIPAGVETVSLTDFDGASVEVQLDPARAPHDNASRYYDRAARSERAAERLPALIATATTDRDRLLDLLASTQDGSADADTIRAAIPRAPAPQRRGDQEAVLPFRSYRSTGGLEIRVGRGARHNDDLTFRHSAPNDIWLHARHTAGAHVILRWAGPGNPPARDLDEAGALAALHSKARTSGSVPVDWTLRKYVRKPRGSAPGAVLPDRVKTIFVAPDEDLLERLAE